MLETLLNGFAPWLEFAYEFGEAGLSAAMLAGFAAGLLAVVVLAINLTSRRWLTAGQMRLLWGLVLVRMMMPIAPASPVSLHNVMNFLPSEQAAAPTDITVGQPARMGVVNDDQTGQTWTEAAVTTVPAEPNLSLIEVSIALLPFVWLGGGLLVLASNVYRHWRFSRKVAQSPDWTEGRVPAIWRRCCQELKIKQEIPVKQCDHVSQPAVMGMWRPTLLLSANTAELDDEELRMVMLHELTHIRRRDVAINWLLVLAAAFQWWNPIFWLAYSRYSHLREQSCDAFVLRHVNGEASPSRRYAEVLLRMAERGSQPGWRLMVPASLLGFLSHWLGRRGFARRLQALHSAAQPQKRWLCYTIAALILAVGLIGLTDAAADHPAEAPYPSDTWKPLTAAEQNALPDMTQGLTRTGQAQVDDLAGPWTERDYNATKAVELISRQKNCSATELPKLLWWELAFNADPTHVTRSTNGETAKNPEAPRRPHAELSLRDGEWIIHVTGPAATHRRFEQAVRAWNRSGLGQVTIETRVATTRGNVMEQMGITWDEILTSQSPHEKSSAAGSQAESRSSAVATVEERIPVMQKTLSQNQMKRFLQNVQADLRSNILFAPKVTLFNGQAGQIVSGVEHPYVTGLTKNDDGGVVPQVEVVDEGFKLSLGAEITADRSGADLTADMDLSDIEQVQTYSTKISGKEVTIQVPRVRRFRVNTRQQLENEQTLMILIPPTYDRKEYTWVLLTPRVLE